MNTNDDWNNPIYTDDSGIKASDKMRNASVVVRPSDTITLAEVLNAEPNVTALLTVRSEVSRRGDGGCHEIR